MQEEELDRFLRKHTELEEILLTPGLMEEKMCTDDRLAFLDENNPKTPPLTKGDFFSVFENYEQVETINSEKFIPKGHNIAFYVQPRYTDFPPHSHSFIEMVYVYSGSYEQRIHNTTIILHQGDMCLLNPNTVHSIEKAGKKDDIIINCLIRRKFFDPALLSRLAGNNLFSQFFIRFISHSKNYHDYIHFHSRNSSSLHQLMRMLLCEYYDQDKCSHEVINSYMIIIFSELLKIYETESPLPLLPEIHNSKISDIILYIQKHYLSATLVSVAEKFQFHPTHLSKLLKQQTGMRFLDIVHHTKLHQATILLKATDLPVSMIANEIGYENVSFFYRVFKKRFFCTPAEYRKQDQLFFEGKE